MINRTRNANSAAKANRTANYENCNHHLTPGCVKTAAAMSAVHGNAPFDWRKEGYSERSVDQLLAQGFLRNHTGARVFRSLEVIGDIPSSVKVKRGWKLTDRTNS